MTIWREKKADQGPHTSMTTAQLLKVSLGKIIALKFMKLLSKIFVHEIKCNLNLCKVLVSWVLSKKQIEWVLHFKISSDTNRKGIISLKSIITRDKTLVYEFIPEMKEQSMIWKHSAFLVQKIFKTQPSA